MSEQEQQIVEQQEQQEQQQQQQQQQEEEYVSSDEDEWTRPAADSVAKKNEEASHDKKEVDYNWDEEEKNLAGGDVIVHFEIHSAAGEVKKIPPQRFVMGVTVAHLKTFLEDSYKIPYNSQQMLLGEQQLIDPLSLNDVGFVAGGDGNVVKVILEQ